MKIDAHQHFWNYDPVRDSWIDNTMKVIQKDFLPADLEPVLKRNGIDGSIAVQADQSETETQFLLDLAAKNTLIKGVVGWVDLKAKNLEERLAHFSKNPLLKGIRHIVQAEPDDFMLGKEFQNGISKLKKHDLTYDILIFPPQIPAAISLAEAFPDQPFVVDHIAKPYIKDRKIEGWQKGIEKLAQSENVYCKVSGMFTEADWKYWKTADFKKYLDVIFKSFGTDRILYGSDWPVCLLATTYEEQLKLLLDYITLNYPQDMEKIMGKNAVKFYKI